mgnify:FL=1
MIIDPPITSISKRANCRYTLIVEVSKRARQLVAGAEPLIPTTETKPFSITVREVDQGLIDYTLADD